MIKSVTVYSTVQEALINIVPNVDLKSKVIPIDSIFKLDENLCQIITGLCMKEPFESYLAFSDHLDCGCVTGVRLICFSKDDEFFKPSKTIELAVVLGHESLVLPSKLH